MIMIIMMTIPIVMMIMPKTTIMITIIMINK